MRSSKLLVILGVVALATPAFAQDAPPPPPGGQPPPGGPATAWPTQMSDRPYTLNQGMLEVHGALSIFSYGNTTVNAMGQTMTSTATFTLGGGGVSFGVSDLLEVGGDYALQLSPNTDAAGVFAGHALYRAVHNDKMSAAIGGAAMFSDSANGVLIAAGASFRYRVTPQLSIYTQTGGIPICGTCVRVLGPVSGQLLIDIPTQDNCSTNVYLSAPVGVGLQANPQLYLFADTSLFFAQLSGNGGSIGEFSDYIGVNLGGWFAVGPKIDIGGSFADDLKHAGDLYLFEGMIKVVL